MGAIFCKLRRPFLTALLLLTALPSVASANDVVGQAGVWEAYKSESNESKAPLYGIKLRRHLFDHQLHIKWVLGKDVPEIMLLKYTWRIPDRTKIWLAIGFDENPAVLTGIATSVGTSLWPNRTRRRVR